MEKHYRKRSRLSKDKLSEDLPVEVIAYTLPEDEQACCECGCALHVMGRKNWLFANTPGGAQASAILYSIVKTAKENGLDPYRYLAVLLRELPNCPEEDWAEFLFGGCRMPESCRCPMPEKKSCAWEED